MPNNQGITRFKKQISNRPCENVGKEELKKGRMDETLSVGAFQI